MPNYTISMRDIIVIAHDLRSCHNVGSLLRTAEGIGVSKVYLTGFTPYPIKNTDSRLPHIAQKLHKQIHKTALGAEENIVWEQNEDVLLVLKRLKEEGYTIIALEQGKNSIPMPMYNPPVKIALLLGREVEGVDSTLVDVCDEIIEIPMSGKKESFNVIQAAAMALYHIKFYKS